jgi:hypothetical protein
MNLAFFNKFGIIVLRKKNVMQQHEQRKSPSTAILRLFFRSLRLTTSELVALNHRLSYPAT